MAHRRVVPVITMLAALGASLPQLQGIALAAGLDEKGEADAKQATRLYKQGQYQEAAEIFARLSVDYPICRSSIAIWARVSITCASPSQPCPTCVATSAAGRTSRLTTRRSWIAGSTRWSNCARKTPRPARRPALPPALPAPQPRQQKYRRHPRLPSHRSHRLRRPQGPPSPPRQPQRRSRPSLRPAKPRSPRESILRLAPHLQIRPRSEGRTTDLVVLDRRGRGRGRWRSHRHLLRHPFPGPVQRRQPGLHGVK